MLDYDPLKKELSSRDVVARSIYKEVQAGRGSEHGGAGAGELAPLLIELGFDAKKASDRLGVASAVKMCRSVMIKGLEAMVIESFTTARAYGVEDAVLASLKLTRNVALLTLVRAHAAKHAQHLLITVHSAALAAS